MREYLTRNTRVQVKERVFTEDTTLKEDGFSVVVTLEGVATVRYHGARGRAYAERFLAEQTENDGTMPVMEGEDYPSFALRGIIEGFYGAPYTWAQRHDLIDFLASHRMNAYFYAPKGDKFHREDWREEYPAEMLAEFAALKKYADEKHVRFYYCIAPGKDFHYADERDYAFLLKKLGSLTACGIEEFAVLFDDISPALTEEERARFSSPAAAHAYVTNYVNHNISHTHSLVFCPTDYFQNADTPYRKELRAYLDGDVQVFWTGYNTVAEAIPARDCIAAQESFARELVLWDNYPVNDFEPKKRVYLGAICNRTRRIAQFHVGCVANPSELWETSKFALSTMAEWMWNAEDYDEEGAYTRAVAEHLGGGEEEKFFADMSRSSVLKRYPTREPLFAEEDWAALDESYMKQRRAVKKVRRICAPALAKEWAPLFAYAEAECDLYRAFRQGEPLEEHLSRMAASPMRTADQSLLRYIAEKGLGQNIELPERAVYWSTERKEQL